MRVYYNLRIIIYFFSHENNQTKVTKVNQPCNKPVDKMFDSIYINFKGILSKKRGSVLGLSAEGMKEMTNQD